MWMCRAAYAAQVRSWPGGVRTIMTGSLHFQGQRVRINLVDAILTIVMPPPGRSDPSLSQCLDVGRHMHYASPRCSRLQQGSDCASSSGAETKSPCVVAVEIP
jgi:hypothetical protein